MEQREQELGVVAPADLPEDPTLSYRGQASASGFHPELLARLLDSNPGTYPPPPPNPLTCGTPLTIAQYPERPHRARGSDLHEGLLIVPSQPGGYLLRAEIGRGGGGTVWEAEQQALARRVALKHLHLAADDVREAQGSSVSAADMERRLFFFRQEAITAASLEHPNIIPVHDLVQGESGLPAITMKRVVGRSWGEVIAEDLEALTPEDFLNRHLPVLVQVAQAVAFAHSRGIIHRDLKPSQVMLGDYGEVLLMDWGLAVVVDPARVPAEWQPEETPLPPTIQWAANPAGTPAFMAPEQTRQDTSGLGPWTDVYLLGGILYMLLTGRPPYRATNVVDMFRRAAKGERVDLAEAARGRPLPPELVALVDAAMVPAWEQRRLTAAQFLMQLREFLSGQGRRHASRELTDAIEAALEGENLTYRDYAELLGRLDNARALWGSNPALAPLAERLHRLYARRALRNGDLTLARMMAERLPAEHGERAAMLAEADAGERRRRLRERQWRVAAAAVLMLTVVSAITATWALREKQRANDQLVETELAREAAVRHAREAEANRRLVEVEQYYSGVGFAASYVKESRLDKALSTLLAGVPPYLRQWEWGHLMASLAADDITLDRGATARGEPVFGADWSPDGTRLLTGHRGGNVRLWDTASGALLAEYAYALRGIWTIRWHPDGRRALLLSIDGRGLQIDTTNGAALQDFSAISPGIMPVFRGGAYSPDGRQFATTSTDYRLRLWDAETAKVEQVVRFPQPTYDAAYSPDGCLVAVGMLFGAGAAIVDRETGTILHRPLDGENRTVLSVAFSPDGSQLALACSDGVVRLFNPWSGEQLMELVAPSGSMRSVVFSPDGELVVACDQNGLIHVWRRATTERLKTQPGPTQMEKLAMHPTRPWLATVSFDELRLWDLNRLVHRAAVRPVAPDVVSADMEHFRVPSYPYDRNTVWFGYDDYWRGEPERKLLALGRNEYVIDSYYAPRSADGRWMVQLGYAVNDARAIDRAGGEQRVLAESDVFNGDFSPDSRWFALLMTNGTVRLFRTADWTEVARLEGQTAGAPRNTAWSLDFSPDSNQLAVGWQQGGIGVYTVPTLAPRWRLGDAHTPGRPVVWLAWSPDATRLASASSDQTARIRQAADGTLLTTLRGHSSNLITVEWSPDGKRVLTTSFDDTVKLWEPETGREILTLFQPVSRDGVMGAFFTRGGERAVVVTRRGLLYELDAAPPGILRAAKDVDADEAMRALEGWKRQTRLQGAAPPAW